MGTANHILALDQGTTSSRAIVFDQFGREVSGPAANDPDLSPPRLGQSGCSRNLDYDAPNSSRRTSTGGVIRRRSRWHRHREPARNARCLGSARRAQRRLRDRLAEPPEPASVEALLTEAWAAYQSKTGLVPDAYFTASKTCLAPRGQPDLRRRAEAGDLLAGTVDSWLLWNRPEARCTPPTSPTPRERCSSTSDSRMVGRALQDMAIPLQMCPGGGQRGSLVTAPELFGAEIPVGLPAINRPRSSGRPASPRGGQEHLWDRFLSAHEYRDGNERSAHRLLDDRLAHRQQVDYALEGSVFISGAAVEWLRDGLGIIDSVQDAEPLAASVPDTGGVTFVPALTGLGAPHWDAAARGTILGLTRGSTAAHIARATLEAIAFQTRDVTDAMTADSGISLASLRVDGGAARNDLLLQIQADVLGVPVIRPQNVETTAVGAAFLAGLGCGLWPDRATLADRWAVDRVFEPAVARPSVSSGTRSGDSPSSDPAAGPYRDHATTAIARTQIAGLMDLGNDRQRRISGAIREAPFFLTTRRTPGRSS